MATLSNYRNTPAKAARDARSALAGIGPGAPVGQVQAAVRFTLVVCLLLFGLPLLGGCGAPAEPLGPAEGRVLFEGEPVTEGMVVMVNRDKGVHMTAPLGEDGRFEFQRADGVGLPLGTYQVAVMPPIPDLPEGAVATAATKEHPNIPVKYRSHGTSGLTATVSEESPEIVIEMTADR